MGNEFTGKLAEKGLAGRFDYLEHPADVYIRAYGNNLIELFENAGLALFETMVKTSDVKQVKKREIVVEGFDLENLLYRWLEDLLTLYYSENIICSKIDVSSMEIIKESSEEVVYKLKGSCWGEPFDPDRHESRVEVKAVTYHLMKIVKDEKSWYAYFVLDI